jgi:hypothetical protein
MLHTSGLASRELFHTRFIKLEKIIEVNMHVRFEIFTAAFKKVNILWHVAPYRLVNT